MIFLCVFIPIALAVLLAAALVGVSYRRFFSTPPIEEPPSECWYEMLDDLFNEHDFVFMRTQPGYSKEIEVRLRRDRIQIAKQYLNRLERDARILIRDLNTHIALTEGSAENQKLALDISRCEGQLFRHLIVTRVLLCLVSLNLRRTLTFPLVTDFHQLLMLTARVFGPANAEPMLRSVPAAF